MAQARHRRVFLSCSSELRRYPESFSFADAVSSALEMTGDHLAGGDAPLTDVDVHVLLVGFRRGGLSRQRPHLSVPEFEFEVAGEIGLPRLIFLLSEDVVGPARMFFDPSGGAGQAALRRQLIESGLIHAVVSSPQELDFALRQALLGLRRPTGPGHRVWNIPKRTLGFVGHTAVLDRISRSKAPMVLTGVAGIGKTTAAIEFAHRIADRFDIGWWVPAHDALSARQALFDLAVAIGAASPETSIESALSMVRRELERRSDWLLIFDGVEESLDEIRGLLDLNGRVLATSRRPDLPGFKSAPVEQLSREQSVELLRGLVPRIEREDADRISAAAADFPLTVTLAAGYIAGLPQPDAKYFLEELRTQGDVMPRLTARGVLPKVSRLVDFVLDRLAGESLPAAQLLTSAAWLAPGPVPLSLFTKRTAPVLPDLLGRAAADPLALADLVSLVADSALASVAPGTLTVHPLVSQVLRETRGSSRSARGNWAATAVRLLRAALPDEPDEHRKPWEQLLPHVLFATDAKSGLDEVAEDVAWLLDGAVRYLELTDQIRRAAEVRDRATVWLGARSVRAVHRHIAEVERRLELLSGSLPTDAPKVLRTMTELAAALQEAGNYEKALQLSERVYTLRIGALGRDHRDTIASRANLATLLREVGDAELAHAHESEIVHQLRALLGEEHPDTMAAEANLAVTLRQLQRYDEAYSVDRSLLDRLRVVFGEYHPRTLLALNSLGNDLLAVGRLDEAQDVTAQVLTHYREVLGVDHPDTLVAATSLAAVWSEQGDHERARRLDEDTLTRYRRTLGDDHPDTLLSANNLAADLRQLGEFMRARDLDEETWSGFRRVFGDDHPDTLRSAGNLALDLEGLGLSKQADALLTEIAKRGWKRS